MNQTSTFFSYRRKLRSYAWLVVFLLTAQFAMAQTSYEAESGTRSDGANLQSCSSCSGSSMVGNLGGTSNGKLTTTVNVSSGGAYNMVIYYATGDQRSLRYTVNGAASTVSCPASGGWTSVGNISRQVNLVSGNNTIVFDNNSGWAPNVDRFTLAPATAGIAVESESGTRSNGANTQSCSSCSGGQLVGNLGGSSNGTVTHTVNVPAAGVYNLTLSYASADPRTIRITANTSTPQTVNCAASGGWTSVATTSLTISLNSGNNTIKFDNNSGWAPNLDKFVLNATSTTTYTISGTITENGNPSSGTTVSLSGAASSSTTTNSSGAYQFTGLAAGNYTVTPSKSGVSFTPANRSYSPLSSNQTSQNFAGTSIPATYSISGTVTESGNPSVGTTINLSGAGSATTTTNSSGTYQFSNLVGGNYTVTPSKSGVTFTPVNRSYSPLGSNQTAQNFAGTSSSSTTLTVESESGTMTSGGSTQTCSGCSGGILVGNLGGSSNGAVTHTVNVSTGGTYNMTLSYATADPRTINISVNGGSATGINCAPSGGWTVVATTTAVVNLVAGNNTIRFDNSSGWGPNLDKFTISQASTATYSISGVVTENGNPSVGTTVSLSGASNSSTTTNSTGAYQFSNLAVGNYTVTPSKTGITFTPGSRSYTPLESNQTSQNFAGSSGCTTCNVSMNFGSNGRVDYNVQTGNYDVFYNNVKIISDAQASVKNGNTTISSRDYSTRTSAPATFSDGIGSGTKYTVTLTGNGLPQMQQIFYMYSGKQYFFTEVVLSGSGISSNYMAPLVSNNVNIQASGDNRVIFTPFDNDTFIRYDGRSMNSTLTNTSSEITAVFENNSRNGLVVGSVEHMVWKTGIKTTGAANLLSELTVWGGYTDASVTRDHRPHGSINGSSVKSPRIFIGYFTDWRVGMEDYGKAQRIIEPPYVFDYNGPTPFGWNSWGAMQSGLTLNKAKAVADFFANGIPAFRNGNTAYIDLDSYWDNLSSGGLTGDFSQLTEFANYCKSKGLKPGIYWAPFVDWGKTERQVEGTSYTYSQIWTRVNGGYHDLDGTRALDPTHPGTKQRLDYVIDKFKACGFEMIKIDFIGHAAIEADSYYDTSVKTGMQAYRKGMEYLIDRLAGQMVVYVAISPNLGTNRYAHMRRIACDAYSAIGETQYTLNSTNYGWWQTYVYDYIDGDHLVLGTRSLGENRARVASAVINGTVITGDDFSVTGQWSTRAQTLFQNQDVLDIARNGVAFMPIEGNAGNQASELFGRQVGNFYYLAVFNYGSSSKTFNIPLSRIGLSGSYSVKELFAGTTFNISSNLNVTIAGADAAIYRFTLGAGRASTESNEILSGDLFPNPSGGVLNVKFPHLKRASILTQTGTEAGDARIRNSSHEYWYEVDVSGLQKGIYILRMSDHQGKTKHVRFVKD